MYEVELKVELTDREKEKLRKTLKERNFSFTGVTPQNDFYIEARESAAAPGYDLKRYRDEEGTYLYTEKTWEIINGMPARKENEREVSEEEFEKAVKKFPDALKIKKSREWFKGTYKNIPISITIDSVAFDHSMNTRYFVEAEIDTEDGKEAASLKELIREFLSDILGTTQVIEAPGMFSMAFRKM